MTRPLLNFQSVEADLRSSNKDNVAKIFLFKAAANELDAGFPPVAENSFALGNSKNEAKPSDRKLLDYLIIGVLSIVIHVSLVDYFNEARSRQDEIVEPVKVPPKVQITLVKPQPKPKPKPVIQPPPPPPPPPPKAVPPKQPSKKLKSKPVVKRVEPPPIQQPAPIVAPKAPVISAPPVAQPAPPPPPPVVEKVTEPKAGADYLNNPSPEYPEAAMDRGLEGKVLMKVHVQPNGKPDTVTVTKSSGHSILDDAAVRTVRQWSFVPAMRGKTPIAGWVTVPITFNLQN